MSSPSRPLFRTTRWLLVAATLLALCLLRWGGTLLVADQSPPSHVDVAIVLQGSISGEKVRIAGAVNLLQRSIADRLLLSVPKESYWGQSIAPVARTYLERTYGNALAARVDFCETSREVDSTAQEAQALLTCISGQNWHSIAIVTSNYHTRRAGIIWKKEMSRHEPQIHIWIYGVPDSEFQQPWWRHRQSAKIFFLETTKLVWTVLGGG